MCREMTVAIADHSVLLSYNGMNPGRPDQAASIRGDLRMILRQHGCPDDLLDDVLLVADELCSNAIMHTRSGLHGGTFGWEVKIRHGRQVVIAVTDQGGPWRPVSEADELAETTRGLKIIMKLSADWGAEGDDRGRTVWACLRWP